MGWRSTCKNVLFLSRFFYFAKWNIETSWKEKRNRKRKIMLGFMVSALSENKSLCLIFIPLFPVWAALNLFTLYSCCWKYFQANIAVWFFATHQNHFLRVHLLLREKNHKQFSYKRLRTHGHRAAVSSHIIASPEAGRPLFFRNDKLCLPFLMDLEQGSLFACKENWWFT